MTKYYIDGPYRCIHCFQLANEISERSYCNQCEGKKEDIPQQEEVSISDDDNSIIGIINRIFKLLRLTPTSAESC